MTVIESDPVYDSRFNITNLLTDGPCDYREGQDSNYILGKNNQYNFTFFVEFSNWGVISKVQLRNSHNFSPKDRYAKHFMMGIQLRDILPDFIDVDSLLAGEQINFLWPCQMTMSALRQC